jgi:hypothetical protein
MCAAPIRCFDLCQGAKMHSTFQRMIAWIKTVVRDSNQQGIGLSLIP